MLSKENLTKLNKGRTEWNIQWKMRKHLFSCENLAHFTGILRALFNTMAMTGGARHKHSILSHFQQLKLNMLLMKWTLLNEKKQNGQPVAWQSRSWKPWQPRSWKPTASQPLHSKQWHDSMWYFNQQNEIQAYGLDLITAGNQTIVR